MATNCQVRDENLQYDINKEAAKNQHYYWVRLMKMYILQDNAV